MRDFPDKIQVAIIKPQRVIIAGNNFIINHANTAATTHIAARVGVVIQVGLRPFLVDIDTDYGMARVNVPVDTVAVVQVGGAVARVAAQPTLAAVAVVAQVAVMVHKHQVQADRV